MVSMSRWTHGMIQITDVKELEAANVLMSSQVVHGYTEFAEPVSNANLSQYPHNEQI